MLGQHVILPACVEDLTLSINPRAQHDPASMNPLADVARLGFSQPELSKGSTSAVEK